MAEEPPELGAIPWGRGRAGGTPSNRVARRRSSPAYGSIAGELLATLGGRYSSEAGIDVDAGDGEIERWFLAATLFGTRISATIAMRTWRVLDHAGVSTIADAGSRAWDELVALLDEGGYVRYDFRTASRLHELARFIADHHPEGMAALGSACRDYEQLAATLDAVPGWGPITVAAFLRELRGVWPGAQPPIDERAVRAANHLRLASSDEPFTVADLSALAADARVDVRDLETALVRLALAHQRAYERCAGTAGEPCSWLAAKALAARDGRRT